jgi:regulator of sirC expression with transglutaminase-like and TPR domain
VPVRNVEQFSHLAAALLLAALPCTTDAAETVAAPTGSPDLVALTEMARKSVVVVTHHGRDGRQEGVGTGFVVDSDGLIATCLHVIGEARPITIELADGRRFEATEVYASDRKLDLAVVRIKANRLPALKLGDSDALKQGAPVVAVGNPLGLGHSVVQGLVSAKRDFDGVEMIQLAIPIESGNSGGPLLDTRGRVHGLLNMKSAMTANLGFAVPVNALKTLLDRPNPVPIDRWLTLGALNPTEWRPVMGARWSRKAGRIQVDGAGAGFGGRSLCLSQQDAPAAPYELSVAVKLADEAGAAGLAFESDGGDRHYGFYPTAGQIRLTRFDGPNVFSWTILKELKTSHYRTGQWNTIKVRVETNRIRGYVNGELVLESTDDAWRGGAVGLAKFRDTKAEFKEFYVGTNAPSVPRTMPSTEEIAAFARKLHQTENDSDAAMMEKMKADAAAGRSALLERAAQLDREAQRMRRVASELHAKSVEAALVSALEGRDENIDLFHAALLVSRLDNPELDIEAYRGELAQLVRELQTSLQGSSSVSDTGKVAALTKFLLTDQGFHGSRTDYYNRANSYINEVMDYREGLPITLSVLFLEMARKIGLTNVTGVPIPTHFMVGLSLGKGGDRFIDVFNGGRLITRSDAVELVADNVERIGDDDFRAATKREIITRMLHNLFGIAQRQGSLSDAIRYLDVIIALNPNSAPDRLSRARLQLQRGDAAAAKADLNWVLDRKPEGVDLERLADLLRTL